MFSYLKLILHDKHIQHVMQESLASSSSYNCVFFILIYTLVIAISMNLIYCLTKINLQVKKFVSWIKIFPYNNQSCLIQFSFVNKNWRNVEYRVKSHLKYDNRRQHWSHSYSVYIIREHSTIKEKTIRWPIINVK